MLGGYRCHHEKRDHGTRDRYSDGEVENHPEDKRRNNQNGCGSRTYTQNGHGQQAERKYSSQKQKRRTYDVHRAIALITVIARIRRKLPPKNTAHAGTRECQRHVGRSVNDFGCNDPQLRRELYQNFRQVQRVKPPPAAEERGVSVFAL
jgi:hypothetical protein